MFNLPAVQAALKEFGFDGWLLCDFRGSNLLARRILDLDQKPITSRRWFYLVPAQGEPQKLVHRIEPGALDHLPGGKTIYLRWKELEQALADLVKGRRKVALEYSPRNGNPYVSRVDAGTVDVLRGTGVELASSGDLIQLFEATWDDEQWRMHLEAAKHTRSAYDRAFGFIAQRVRQNGSVRESEVIQVIMDHFQEHGLTTYSPPIVGVGPHSGDPHYETTPATDTAMKEGDFVLIDLWAKVDQPRSVYSDLTWVGCVGKSAPAKYEEVFQIVRRARDAAIERVQRAFGTNEPLQGWQVDDACRDVIEKAGYGKFFVHRTGHSIGQEVHGNGANMDNLETHEERRVMRRTCFSVEPGIYQPEFGVRSETNVFVDGEGKVHVTGGELQTSVVPILAAY
jgi:Xaa-Pro aminopeptidase